MDCANELKRTVPLSRAVHAAIIDVHQDIGRVQELFFHWAARGFRQLNRQSLHMGLRRVTLTVNRNTNTATLPPDFDEELFVGVIENGIRIPLVARTELVDSKHIEDIPCEDKCPRCSQSKSICDELTVTEDVQVVEVNGIAAQQTVVKRMMKDGSYYLETTIPVWDYETETIIYTTTKQFITKIDLKPCGCPEDTQENIQKIACCNYDVYCAHYTSCSDSCEVRYGGYRIFENTGVIQLDGIGKFTKVYMEYWGFLPKKNGQYHIPEVSFETVVEWTKFKWVQNKSNIPLRERDWNWSHYKIARANMEKELGRIPLEFITNAIGLLPKFDIGEYFAPSCYAPTGATVVEAAPISSACDVPEPMIITQAPCPVTRSLTPFQLAVIAGMGGGPVANQTAYSHPALIDALNLNMIIVNNVPETILANQFTFNPVTGTIDRSPNQWVDGDVLIVNFAKLI